jgi:hypothetical protein
MRLWKEKVVGSSFVRGGGLRGRLNDDHKEVVLHHHVVEPLKTFDNEVLLDRWLPLVQPFDAERICGVLKKIVRCLHFNLFGINLPANAQIEIDITPFDVTDMQLLYNDRTGEVGDYDEFVFRREDFGADDAKWLLGFYNHHTFTVTVRCD